MKNTLKITCAAVLASLLSIPYLAAGQVATFTNSYSDSGVLIQSVEKGNKNVQDNETTKYDALGRACQITTKDSKGKKTTTTIEYNALGETAEVKAKDSKGNVTQTIYEDHGASSETYYDPEDGKKKLIAESAVNSKGVTVKLEYSGSKVAAINYFDGTGKEIEKITKPSSSAVKEAKEDMQE